MELDRVCGVIMLGLQLNMNAIELAFTVKQSDVLLHELAPVHMASNELIIIWTSKLYQMPGATPYMMFAITCMVSARRAVSIASLSLGMQ